MKKLSKKTYILVAISITMLIYFIGMYNYKKPITIHKTFNEVIVTNPSSKEVLKKTTIEINAKLYRGVYTGSIVKFNVHFTNKLEGKIIIDNKEYTFWGITKESNLINIYCFGDDFLFKMNDLDTIHLMWLGNNNYIYDGVTQPK